MDLAKIKTLIDFVGQSNVTELTVSEKDTTVRIFRTAAGAAGLAQAAGAAIAAEPAAPVSAANRVSSAVVPVVSPIFGVLHVAPAPGEKPFVAIGDDVAEGQTLFIIEAMKVFNMIAAPRAGKVIRLSAADGGEVEAGDMLAEIE